MRKLLTFVTATLVTIFSYLLFFAPQVYAVDASWEDGSISYNGDTYRGPTEVTEAYDLPSGTTAYNFRDGGQMKVIYLDVGETAGSAETGNYVTYDFSELGGFSNKSSVTEIEFDLSTLSEADQPANPDSSSCKIDGVGWIVCPVTTFLATGMDWVFDVISGFLRVRPLDTVEGNTMLNVWMIMRNFANIAFVIAFLFIIYSQLTSFGLNNYGIKKIFPRLIIAAILVNVSYWICAIAIDISNILGYSLQNIFINMRNNLLGGNGNSWDLVSWESVTGFILSGGALLGATAIGAVTTLGTLAGSFSVVGVALLLTPILVGALLTVLVVLFILAARQAIITLLVIISPLAFVAYLLPNTEKWFEKWRNLFMTMLILFPAFSLIFGGAQLAGILIIQNADDINVLLLGMAVQIAPLAITPLLFKFSGSLLTRIAGMVNNPNRGMLDRTKNWSKDRLEHRQAHQMKKNRQLSTQGKLGRHNFARRGALALDNQKRLRDGWKSIDESDANALFTNSGEGRQLHEAEHTSKILKEKIETEVNIELKRKINLEGSTLHLDNLNLEVAKSSLKNQEAVAAEQMANYRTGEYLHNQLNPALDVEARRSIGRLGHLENEIAIHGLAAQSAKRVSDSEFATYMENTQRAQDRAGGVEGVTGAQRALASALKTQQSSYQEAVSNAGVILDHGNYENSVITDLALGHSGKTNIVVTDDIKAAAIKRTAGGKDSDEFIRLFKNIDIANLSADLRQELGDSAMANSDRPKWMGAATIGKIKQGDIAKTGDDRIHQWVVETVNADKLSSAETLVSQDKSYLKEVLNTLSNPAAVNNMNIENLTKVKEQIHMALHDNRFKGRIGERDENLGRIYDKLPSIAGLPDDYSSAKTTPPTRRRP